MPLTGGFFGKFYIFKAALDSAPGLADRLGLLNSAVAAYYYLRILVDDVHARAGRSRRSCRTLSPGMRIALLLPALGTLLLGIFPTWVLEFAGKSSAIVK